MTYISTRGGAPRLAFEDAVLAGLARDGGLYVPETWPQFSRQDIAALAGKPFADVAVDVIAPFTGGQISRADLSRMAHDAYASFEHSSVAPLVQLAPGQYVLELFHGPTLAFKDVAMQLLARLMDHILEKRGTRLTIVGATSGDTGGAAIEAFRGSKHSDVIILFPQGRVSDVQRRMMTTPQDANVAAVAIDGTFDDCQALVKAMFNDHKFRDAVNLSGVNSINWARIVAQITYYFTAAVALGSPDTAVSFAVPTGNFGDIFAGYAAKRMGLSIDRLIIASNNNDILPRTVSTGTYEKRGVVATTSPSMDIEISSNFERYLFEASGRDAEFIKTSMRELTETGRFALGSVHGALKRDFAAASASEIEVAACIRLLKDKHGYSADPHTTCGLVAASKVAVPGNVVTLATAHPAKFPDAVGKITGERPALPPRLAHLMTDKEHFEVLPNSLEAIEKFVKSHTQSAERAST